MLILVAVEADVEEVLVVEDEVFDVDDPALVVEDEALTVEDDTTVLKVVAVPLVLEVELEHDWARSIFLMDW